MSEYIDRHETIQAIKEHCGDTLGKLSEGFPIELQNAYILGHQHCMQVVSLLPAADVVERKTGKWEKRDEIYAWNAIGFYYLGYQCGECGCASSVESNFCPNCGARMVNDE